MEKISKKVLPAGVMQRFRVDAIIEPYLQRYDDCGNNLCLIRAIEPFTNHCKDHPRG